MRKWTFPYDTFLQTILLDVFYSYFWTLWTFSSQLCCNVSILTNVITPILDIFSQEADFWLPNSKKVNSIFDLIYLNNEKFIQCYC